MADDKKVEQKPAPERDRRTERIRESDKKFGERAARPLRPNEAGGSTPDKDEPER